MRKQLLAAAPMIAMAQPAPAPDYTSCGKQILRGGQHIADAVSPELAGAIAHALNGEILFPLDLSEAQLDQIQKVLWP